MLCQYTGLKWNIIQNRMKGISEESRTLNTFLDIMRSRIYEIQKDLIHDHARHTFAAAVTLANRVPIESVSKMLGHKSIKTTQHYAKILDRKVSGDMSDLKLKLQEKERIRTEEKKAFN